jgi:hypothetical protein
MIGVVGGQVQGALFAFLATAGLSCPVLDDVPSDTNMPYISIGQTVETAQDNESTQGRSLLVTFDVWSRYAGWEEADTLADALVRALDRQQAALVAPGLSVWRLAFTHAAHIRLADLAGTRQIAVEFQVDLQDAS